MTFPAKYPTLNQTNLTPEARAILERIIRVAFPHPNFPDAAYQRMADRIVAEADSSTWFRVVLTQGLIALGAQSEQPFLELSDERALAAAVRSVAAGEGTLDQRLTRRILHEFVANRRSAPSSRPPAPAGAALTDREVDVLRLLAEGLSNAEIAHRLFVEPTTVKYHLAGILTKTGARDRLQAVVWAFTNGVVSSAN